jgi:hypothetical protein
MKKWSSLLDSDNYRKATRRAESLSKYELLSWADIVGTDAAWNLNDYRKTSNLYSLDASSKAIATLSAIVDELQHRYGNLS